MFGWFPRYRPRDFVVETCKEKRAAEPADAARIQLAGSKQVGFVLLKAIGPGHMQVFDVDDSAVGRFRWCDGPLVGTEIRKRLSASGEFQQRIADAIKSACTGCAPGLLRPLL